MRASVFDHKHYRDYLKIRLNTSGESRGLRARLAELTHTTPAFISRVLSGKIDLSPEHIPHVNKLLEHSKEEAHFFTLLTLEARAGNRELESYYREQLNEFREKRNHFLERVKITDKVSVADHAKYNSQWYYTALHILAGIPAFQTREAMSKRLQLPLSVVSKALEELMSMGLIEAKGSKFIIGKKRIHLDKNSPWITQLHTLFRQRVIQQLAAPDEADFHFSLAMGVSKSFMEEYKKRMIDLISEFEVKMIEAKEEELYALNIDLFRF
jgi:uncharacterized protein (TIGR02147 family)